MKRGHVIAAAVLLALGGLAVAAGAPEIGHRVTIGPAAVEPPMLVVGTGERVTFVNRAGGLVHLEFARTTPGHRVFQVPGEIWVEFHRTGRHEYVVHLGARSAAGLEGVVVVRPPAATPPSPALCPGFVVMGECLER